MVLKQNRSLKSSGTPNPNMNIQMSVQLKCEVKMRDPYQYAQSKVFSHTGGSTPRLHTTPSRVNILPGSFFNIKIVLSNIRI